MRQHPKVLAAHLQTLAWQKLPTGVSVDFAFIDDNDDSASSDLLRSFTARTFPAGDRAGALYAVDDHTHRWNVEAFSRLGAEKQRLLDLAVAEGYDAVWLVDSDLLCSPDTLASLIATKRDIVSAVFWTQWEPNAPPMPQVWQSHPYGMAGAGWQAHEFLRALDDRQLVRVRGLGACTLIKRGALEKGVSFAPVPGMPSEGMWQGEDRHFCVRAERLHIALWADSWPNIFHCYRPSDREHIESMLARLQADTAKSSPFYGDWISFTIEPLSEPSRAGASMHLRGRLGSIAILPELEHALLDMSVGDSRIISIRFPEWWEVTAYRHQEKIFRLCLLGVQSPDGVEESVREFAAPELAILRNAREAAA